MNVNSGTEALSGVRVLDLTSVIMGPYATHILADLGADVIKIESPEGDSFRSYLPARHEGMYGSFLNLHRNKKSIVLNLKTELGKRALDRLIAKADVLVHTMRPATIEGLGYPFEKVHTMNPKLIYCGAFGFGSQGPYRDKAAYDDLIQAGSGIAALHQDVYGEPLYVPTVLCDKLAGQAVAYAILAALFQRTRTGRGQQVEVPMFETSIEFALVEHAAGFAFEPSAGPPGFPRVLSKERKPFRTKNGFACILPYSNKNWQDFYRFTERTEFLDDPRFRTLQQRVQHIHILYDLIRQEAQKRTNEEWESFCDKAEIPCIAVRTLAELREDRHLKSVEFFQTSEHPSEGTYRTVRRPVLLSDSPFQVRTHAPRLGEHTDEVLSEEGFSADEIAAIAKQPRQ